MPSVTLEETLLQKIPLLKKEIKKAIVGQETVIEQVLICLLAGGHGLLEGVPGLAKTLLINTIAKTLNLSFNRIQFTPDLMPADLIGYEIFNEEKKIMSFLEGPLFASCILADEINRTPAKTQAALLEAMQEKAITVNGNRMSLPKPFFIMATQNPIEQAGTYTLPEAQLDRFLLYIKVPYPTENEELKILESTTGTQSETINTIFEVDEILKLQEMTRQVHIDSGLMMSVNKLIRETRPETTSLEIVKESIEFGAGPRAGQALILCAKARALINQRVSVIPDDLISLSSPVLGHRIRLNYLAESKSGMKDRIIGTLIKNVLQ